MYSYTNLRLLHNNKKIGEAISYYLLDNEIV